MSKPNIKIIVFEGVDGCGKTTQIKKIENFINDNYPNLTLITLREPGNTMVGNDIRNMLLNKELYNIKNIFTELLLFNASRVETLHTLDDLDPNKEYVVLFDRFWQSSVVYQILYSFYTKKLKFCDYKTLHKLQNLILKSSIFKKYKPNINILFDIDKSTIDNRLKQSGRILDDIEKNINYDILIEQYREFWKANDSKNTKYKKINANQNIDFVFEDLKKLIIPILEN